MLLEDSVSFRSSEEHQLSTTKWRFCTAKSSMSFIRSRLRNTGEDQGSPSRSASLFHQLASLLSHDDSSPGNDDFSDVNDEFLSLVMGNEGDDGVEQASSASSRELAAAATHHEDVGDPPSLTGPSTRDQPSNHQQRPPLLINLVGGHMTGSHSDSFDLASSDRDTDRENGCLTEGSTASSSVRRRALQAVPSSGTKNERTGSRYRFGRREKRRLERTKSLDRSDKHSVEDGGNEGEMMMKRAPPSPSRLPHRRIAAWARELMDDLQSIEEAHSGHHPTESGEDPGEPLAIKRLKNNVMRFSRVTGPISSVSDSIQSLRQWRSPTATLLFILVVSYTIWHGFFLSLIVSASLFKLTTNYLITQGWMAHLGWTSGEDGSEEVSEETSVADRLAVVLQVARKVQNQLGAVCDAAEKIKNLLMWRHEASRRLYLMFLLALPLTLFVPSDRLFSWLGFYLVTKLFIIDYVFLRFPRLRAKYDSSALMWETLPTDADLDSRKKYEQGLSNAAAANGGEIKTFWESFNLPLTENPLPGWSGGLRCTLVNRDKSLTSSIKSGRLFLTPNHLCFERSKTHPDKNVVISLDRIVRLEKGNQYSWIPGGGMIIEVFIQGMDRAYIFGAIMNRDDVFTAIRDAAEKMGCVWREDSKSPSSPSAVL